MNDPVMIGEATVKPGTKKLLELPIAKLVTGTPMSLPVVVLNGRRPGPSVWLTAAIHGDEINGTEIVRQVLETLSPKNLNGTLFAVPVVNVYGFVAGDRYLPDRRDLNRPFPGSARGSLARRIAHLLMTEVVGGCDYGIDLHTASDHRTNLPQIRANLDDPETKTLSAVFGAPLMMHSSHRDGSLRQAASEAGAKVLLYEGGEAWRFDPYATRVGVDGVRRVLAHVGMIDAEESRTNTTAVSRSSKWVRASQSGILGLRVDPGNMVQRGQVIGQIHNALGVRLSSPRAPIDGMVIGSTQSPVVNRGDAILHIASISETNGTSE
ncbi:MAG: succinylglutamate desuccinylase/aspartoacylase family protein [Acidimicrobiia bacterium]|nr:succinylglutamate desuccinylase/aspartoacylase family protein [Acidimicrobiia bacterium]